MVTTQSIDWQGRMINRYRLQNMLGRGGMGEVWLAEDTQLRRQVAIKLLPAVLASDHRYLQDFAREAQTAASLEHPHILQVHDFGEEPTADGEIITYLIMPHITGGSLRDRIRNAQGPLPADQALSYLKQAAEAIDYAHSRKVLHRDIKPGNMLMQQDWLFLADFGIAKITTGATRRTQTHAGAGTPEYMAPEQVQGRAEAASDLYSLAVIAYHLFTGNLPFRAENPYDILIKQIQEAPTPPSQLNPGISQALENTLLQGLGKQPSERPASCLTFVNAIEQAWKTQALTPGVTYTPPNTASTQTAATTDPERTLLAPWSKRLRAASPTPLPFSVTPAPTPHQSTNSLGQPTVTATTQPQGQFMAPGINPGIKSGPIQQGSVTPSQEGLRSTFAAQANAATATTYVNNPGPLPRTPEQPFPGEAQTLYSPPAHSPYPGSDSPQQPEWKRLLKRREVLIGGAAGAAVLIAGGIAIPMFMRSTQTTQKPAPTPPGPHKLISGKPLLALTGHKDEVWCASWDPSGRYLATGSKDTRVMLWDIESYLKKQGSGFQTISQPLQTWKFANIIYNNSMSWSPDGHMLAIIPSSGTNQFFVVNPFAKNNSPQKFLDIDQANSFSAPMYSHGAWAPHSNTFATSSFSKTDAQLWQPTHPTGPVNSLHYAADSPVEVELLGWSADGSLLAGSTNNFKVVVWDPKTGKVKQVLSLPQRTKDSSVMVLRDSLQWSPANPAQLLASDLEAVIVWDAIKGKILYTLGTDDQDALTIPPQMIIIVALALSGPRTSMVVSGLPTENISQAPMVVVTKSISGIYKKYLPAKR
nr:serine/threonine-protein kinase [Ktedonosporobacter rubrisoli]